jgi:protein O-mannosyl-transferase
MQSDTDSPVQFAHREWVIAGVLAVCIFVVFAPVLDAGFVDFDDTDYVDPNPHVQEGLSAESIGWAFTTYHAANWHPLTWLSLQLDVNLWGPGPRGFHFTNLLLHAANAALLFLALHALTGATWRSAAVTLLFAVHPLRAESVAWISERKDVLCAFFGFAALWAYADYARAPSVGRYLRVAAALALSLMSKPMLVTFPFVLLILDWWPLRRGARDADQSVLRIWLRLIAEKLPFLAMAVASAVVTMLAQADGNAVVSLHAFPLWMRAGNAAISYVMYLHLTIWPIQLAPYYRLSLSPLPAWQTGGAFVLLAALTLTAIALRRRAPYLLAGWLWFIGTLVPVIGLVQVGLQSYADRYTYFPQVGLIAAACWGLADLAGRYAREALALACAAALTLAALTWNQVQFWHDSFALWDHDIHVTGDNPEALLHLGEAFAQQKKIAEAADCYRRMLAIDPDSVGARSNLGSMLRLQGNLDEAERLLREALQIDPGFAKAHVNLGNVLFQRRDLDEATKQYEEAVKLDPQSSDTYVNLAIVAEQQGDNDRAASYYWEALRIRPNFPKAAERLQRLLARTSMHR